MVHSPLYRKKSIIELLLSHAAVIQINYPTIDPRLLLLYIVCLWSMTSTAVFFTAPWNFFMVVSTSQYQSQLPVIWFLISIMGNFFIGRERLLPNVAWLGHFSLGLDMTRHAVLLGNSVAQGGMSWIGRIPCFVFSWLVQKYKSVELGD